MAPHFSRMGYVVHFGGNRRAFIRDEIFESGIIIVTTAYGNSRAKRRQISSLKALKVEQLEVRTERYRFGSRSTCAALMYCTDGMHLAEYISCG